MQATGNKSTLSYSLSIRLAADGFSFYVKSPSDFMFVQREAYTYKEGCPAVNTLTEALNNSTLLKRDFASVRVLVNAPTAHIPLDVFKQDEAEPLYRLTFAGDAPLEEDIYYNVLARPEMVVASALPGDIHNLLHERYPQHRLFSVDSTLMPTLMSYDESQPASRGRRLYAYLHEGGMNLYAPKSGKMLFANQFEAQAVPDRIYFILHVWRELALDARRDTLFLLGSATDVLALREALARYLQHIETPTSHAFFPNLPQLPGGGIPFDLFTLFAYSD